MRVQGGNRMKIIETLPKEEQLVYHTLLNLGKREKEFMWTMIQKSDSNHNVVCQELNREIRRLESMGLIVVNRDYVGLDFGFIILPQAPVLMAKLRKVNYRKSGLNTKGGLFGGLKFS